MASGNVNRIKGRTHGCTANAARVKNDPCQLGAVHTWPIAADIAVEPNVGFRGTADIVRSGDQAHR